MIAKIYRGVYFEEQKGCFYIESYTPNWSPSALQDTFFSHIIRDTVPQQVEKRARPYPGSGKRPITR